MKVITKALIVLLLAVGSFANAAEPVNTLEKSGFFSYKPSGIAIRGYDPVAYFTQGEPVDGDDRYTTTWNGASWRFSSQQHLDLFTADPEKYAPQYGGYCAYGVAQGYLVKVEPQFWAIRDDKLYLNYDKKVQRKWEKDIPGFIDTADQKFDDLLSE